MDLNKLLNKEQYEAATTVEGPLLILAGAGSGKTRVLTYRIAHLVKNLEIYPSQILAITFTNKAANEMKERVKNIIGAEAGSIWISTFHSSCVKILRREIEKLGYNKNFAIYDSYDQKTLMKECIKELNLNEKDFDIRSMLNKISEQKDNLISPAQFKRENEGNFRLSKIADLYELYQKKLKNSNALDFDDLIYKTVELFKNNEDVLEFYQRKFKYIMVDEYQDTNKSQYELTRLLAMAHKNICVVGDDDQCIYAWRGADIRNILDFEKDYPNAKVIKLEENYRSKANILNAANSVIKNNCNRKNKVLRTSNKEGQKIKIYRASSDIQEAQFVAGEIKKMLGKDREFKDFAILYRTNAQSRIFEEAFMRANIPYKIIGGLKFYDRKEIKDIMAYLKLINNPLDDISLKRIINEPKRSIGDTTVAKVQEFAAENSMCMYDALLDAEFIPSLTARAISSINKFVSLMNTLISDAENLSVSHLIEEILDRSGYMKMLKSSNSAEDESRVENLKELVSDAVAFENSSEDKSLGAFLEKVTLVSDIDNLDEENNAVVMMTVHSAKGLEFPVVFLVGMENGIFPGMSSLNSNSEMEESRRLAYVAITRAKENLYISSAEQRMVYGRTVTYQISDFVNEIPRELKSSLNEVSRIHPKPSSLGMQNSGLRSSSRDNNPHSFRNSFYNNLDNKDTLVNTKSVNNIEVTVGRKVKHGKFGIGTVVSVSKDSTGTIVTIAFNNMGIKKLMLDKAGLELL